MVSGRGIAHHATAHAHSHTQDFLVAVDPEVEDLKRRRERTMQRLSAAPATATLPDPSPLVQSGHVPPVAAVVPTGGLPTPQYSVPSAATPRTTLSVGPASMSGPSTTSGPLSTDLLSSVVRKYEQQLAYERSLTSSAHSFAYPASSAPATSSALPSSSLRRTLVQPLLDAMHSLSSDVRDVSAPPEFSLSAPSRSPSRHPLQESLRSPSRSQAQSVYLQPSSLRGRAADRITQENASRTAPPVVESHVQKLRQQEVVLEALEAKLRHESDSLIRREAAVRSQEAELQMQQSQVQELRTSILNDARIVAEERRRASDDRRRAAALLEQIRGVLEGVVDETRLSQEREIVLRQELTQLRSELAEATTIAEAEIRRRVAAEASRAKLPSSRVHETPSGLGRVKST
jgi:hypothetical protein